MKKYLSNPYLVATIAAVVAFFVAFIDNDTSNFKDFSWWGKIAYCIVLSYLGGVLGLIVYMIWLMLMKVYCWKFGHRWHMHYYGKGLKFHTEKCSRCKKVMKVDVTLPKGFTAPEN